MKKIMLGNEAFARGAYEAGVKVVSSYPGTPSTEITESAVQYDEVYVEWAANEKVAMEVAIGAAFGGVRSLTTMKHVGLNVAADPLFTAAYAGVNAGFVAVVADDPGMHSSQNEQDSRFYARSAHVPMLEPADSEEARDYMVEAYKLSEQFDTPVLMRSNTRLSHSRGIVDTHDRVEVPKKEYTRDISKYVMMPAMARAHHKIVEQRERDLAAFAETTPLNRVEMRDTKIGVITAGVVYQYVREALPEASILKLGMVYPLPDRLIRDFAAKVDRLYIIEELEPFFENQIRVKGIPCTGKEIFTLQGEYSVNMIRSAVLGEQVETYPAQELPGRPPVLCPGCPHRGLFYGISKCKLMATGDIGCYTLGVMPPLNAMDTCICMGASVSMAHGFEKACGDELARKMVAVIGDSTFLHSGMTGLLNSYYNHGTTTVVIVDNSITAMTGHQNHAMTGFDAKGNPAPRVDLETLVRALGIEHVRVVDPFDLPAVEAALKEETARREMSVIISRRPCIFLDKSYIKPALVEDNQKCKNCGMCMRLGCPAIQKTQKGIKIDASLCTGCGLCQHVCKFDAIKEAGK